VELTAVMIDKVELRIRNFIHFAGPFNRLFRDVRNDPKGPFRNSLHFMAVGDLRDYGYPVILHTHNVHDRCGNHKLELIETGEMTYSQMRYQIERIFAVNTNRDGLELMRLDLAADVEGVPVSWFQRNIRARFKRFANAIGTIEGPIKYSEIGRQGVETFYLGKRPNLIRIYDKVGERWERYSRMLRREKRKHTAMSEVPTFQQMFGHACAGVVLTRVERQIAGGRIPERFATFDRLRSVADFDPFESLIYIGVGKPEPNADDYDLRQYLTGMQIRAMVERDGIHRFLSFANKHSKRNGMRLLKQYEDFLPSDGCFVSPKGLFDRFRESVTKQLTG
jgi:hypothetical protein